MYKNYNVIKKETLKDIACEGVLLEHIKTGAKVLLFSCEDENKTFAIGFRTPPYDDTGLPHILEHSVLCGSRKYPVKEPFVELMKSSLNTFLNAMTFPDKTVYPIASCNDQDFKNLMDVYLDAVFYPNIYNKKEIFLQEGWHYELDSVDSEITYNGVVYNEMKGAFSSPDQIMSRETFNSLFPDTAYGVESGGNPAFIPTLSYEQFVAFHKKYYHPTNSYIILYGNCDMEERLEFLDKEYLSRFEKISIDSEIKEQPCFKSIKEKTVQYPVTKEQGTNGKSYISYGVALPKGMSVTELYAFDVITKVLLGAQGAPLERAILDAGIGNYVEGSFESQILQPLFNVTTKDAKETDKEQFIKVIEDTLSSIVKKGFDKKALQAAINKYEFRLREAEFGGMSKGLIYGLNALGTWLYDDLAVFEWSQFDKIFTFLKEQINTDYYETLVKKYVLDNNHKVLVLVNPNENLQDEKELKLKEELANYKNGLSKEELEQLVQDTKNLKAYQASDDSKEDLDTIPLLKKEDLSYDVVPLSNNVHNVEGVTVVHHDYPTNGIAIMNLIFNAKHIPAHLLKYYGMFIALIGSLDTKEHTYQTLDQDIDIHTGGISTSMFTKKVKDDLPYVGFSFNSKAVYEKISYALSFIKEMIHDTNYDMKQRVLECLQMEMAKTENRFSGAGHVVSITRAQSYIDELNYYSDSIAGINYFNYLNEVLKDYDNQYEILVNAVKEIASYIFTKDNMMVSFTGNFEGYQTFEKELSQLIQSLPDKKDTCEEFKFVPKQLNEGFKAPYDVLYVALCGNYKKDGLEYTGALNVFQNALGADYLWKQVRVLGGAYGCMCGFGSTGDSYFVSYRDPNLENTLKVYKGVLDYIDNFKATDEEMLKFIIGAVGSYDYPLSPAGKGSRSFSAYLKGLTEEDFKLEKKQMIDATEQDIKNIRPIVESIIKQNNICVVGNEKKIEESTDIFKTKEMLLK